MVALDVAGAHRARALLRETQLRLLAGVQARRDLLEVQQDVDHVFLDAFDAGVLVEHAFDLGLGDRAAGHRGQEHATQRVAERMAEAALERLDHDARMTRRARRHLYDARLQKLGHG